MFMHALEKVGCRGEIIYIDIWGATGGSKVLL